MCICLSLPIDSCIHIIDVAKHTMQVFTEISAYLNSNLKDTMKSGVEDLLTMVEEEAGVKIGRSLTMSVVKIISKLRHNHRYMSCGQMYFCSVDRSSNRSCTSGMIHNKIHRNSPRCPQPIMALQCRIVAYNTILFILFSDKSIDKNI